MSQDCLITLSRRMSNRLVTTRCGCGLDVDPPQPVVTRIVLIVPAIRNSLEFFTGRTPRVDATHSAANAAKLFTQKRYCSRGTVRRIRERKVALPLFGDSY